MTLSIRVFEDSPDRGCASDTVLECLINYSCNPLINSSFVDRFMLNAQAVLISTSLAMAHMNAQSSRAIAAIISWVAFPLANSRL